MRCTLKRNSSAMIMVTMSACYALGAEVDPSAYAPMTEVFYPRTFATWGDNGVERIDELRREAALKVAADPSCDTVYGSELSDNRSSAPDQIVVFVDCENGARFYISESDIIAGGTIASQEEKQDAISDGAATTACEDAVLRWASSPTTVAINRSTLDVYRAPTTGNIAVTFDFEAVTDFGGSRSYGARCVLDDRGVHPVEISERF